MMADIAHTIELSHPQYSVFESTHTSPIVDTVSDAVVRAAVRAKAVAIVALTESGGTARMLSRFRPDVPIICFTPHEMVQRQLALSYACTGILTKRHTTIDAVIADARSQLVTRKLAKKGDTIVISAGIPFGEVGSTNLLLVQRV
jgi:pyruvate kinase